MCTTSDASRAPLLNDKTHFELWRCLNLIARENERATLLYIHFAHVLLPLTNGRFIASTLINICVRNMHLRTFEPGGTQINQDLALSPLPLLVNYLHS